MSEKRKSRPSGIGKTSKTSRIGRDAVTGKFTYANSAKRLSSSVITQSEGRTSPRPKVQEKLQARPMDDDVNVHQFAKDLLVTDKDIMDYLAR